MAAYRRVYDSRHLQADCQLRTAGSAPEHYTLGIRVWAAFRPTFFTLIGRPTGSLSTLTDLRVI